MAKRGCTLLNYALNEINLFGDIYNGELKLNIFGKIAEEEWLNTIQIRDNIQLHQFIIMPNHFHAIVEILTSKTLLILKL